MTRIARGKYLPRDVIVLTILIMRPFPMFIPTRSFAGIVGSLHDFSHAPLIKETHGPGEICKICHVPHNAETTEVPLWRRHLTSNGTYNLYSSDTLDATVNQPMSPTKACLACHDGTLARRSLTGSYLNCHQFHGNTLNLALHYPVSIMPNLS